ncbi:hypothetical protein [Terasakiella sp. SH-1]|uniref:hypothetical protein n=1 Tax=Terasakiella sp. SH-1 TaxID=2560057 RepID=UPI001073B2C0|nr:hypothetical protein [Terasakiella sp. SH-1]
MWPFGSKPKPTTTQEQSEPQEVVEPLEVSEPDEWSNIRVEGSKIIYGDLPLEADDPANVSSTTGGDITDRVRAEIMAHYPVDEFHKNVIKITYFLSKIGKLESLEIDKNNQDFFDACEVVHRRLANPTLEPVLKLFASDDIKDIFVLYYGAGPVVSDIIAELKAKKKARIERKMGQKGKAKTQETAEERPITPQSEEIEYREGDTDHAGS